MHRIQRTAGALLVTATILAGLSLPVAAAAPDPMIQVSTYAAQVGASVRTNPDTQQTWVVWQKHVWLVYPVWESNFPGETAKTASINDGRLLLPQSILEADMPPTPQSASKTPQPFVAAPLVARLLSVVRSAVGTPYLWAGATPAGFDCSGLVQWAYAKVGVHVPRTSFSQFNAGQPVSTPVPGDLVFFSTAGPGASHVGVYLGAGLFASSDTRGVQISSMDAPYWAARFVGARRVPGV